MSGEGTIEEVLSGSARWAVLQGDCLSLATLLPDRAIDRVHTDPPYSEHVHTKSRGSGPRTGTGHQCVREHEFGFAHLTNSTRKAITREIVRVCRRWALVFCDLESVHLWRRGFTICGWEPVRTGIWAKLGCTPQLTGDRPAVAAEAIVIAHPPGRKHWNSGGKRGIWSHPIVGGGAHNSGPHRKSERVHTAQKPLPLMLEIEHDFGRDGEIVWDPFCGSGTSGVAALRAGRSFIGFELDANYAAVARERLCAEERGLSLSAARAGQGSLFG